MVVHTFHFPFQYQRMDDCYFQGLFCEGYIFIIKIPSLCGVVDVCVCSERVLQMVRSSDSQRNLLVPVGNTPLIVSGSYLGSASPGGGGGLTGRG